MPTYKTPDVYIEEFEPAAPITGVGTSTAAFLGPCMQGPLNVPTAIMSWDGFTSVFGAAPVPGFFIWYAVRGFFENGGTECYVTRVSNATIGELPLVDINGNPTLIVRALNAGVLSTSVKIAVDSTVQMVKPAAAHLYRPTATIAVALVNTTDIIVTAALDAATFRPGDRITWVGVAAADDNPMVARVSGSTITVFRPLSQAYGAGVLSLANPMAGDDQVRLEGAPLVAPGQVLALKQLLPAAVTQTVIVSSVIVESGAVTTYRVSFRSGLTAGFDFTGGPVTAESFEFQLTVTSTPPAPAVAVVTPYNNLGMDSGHPNYYARVTASDPNVVVLPVDPPNLLSAPPNNRPATVAVAVSLPNGLPDTPATLTSASYGKALDGLQPIDGVNIVVIPDRADKATQGLVVTHCELMQDRFAVLQTAAALPPYGTTSADTHRDGLISTRGYAALYYPWIQVFDDKGVNLLMVPPSGHVAGIYARTDQNRGVHKAPAGLDSNVRGALGVERLVSAVEQGDLNIKGVNVLRVFGNGAPPTVWGARTLASGPNGDVNWQYVNIRRLFLYLEESIQEGIRGAVFEPNNLSLWQQLKRTLGDFLTRSWREGALFGAKAEEAFYVRIDEVLNPFSEQQLGRLHIEIGVRPSYPAEFIIVRIGIWDGGSQVSET